MPSIDATIRATRRPFTPPRVSGLVQLDADDVAGPPPAEGGNVAEATARFDAIQQECNRDGLRYHALDLSAIDPNTHTKAQMHAAAMEYAAAFADIQSSLGLCYEHAAAGKAALGKVPEPGTPPPEPPVGYDSFGGTYDASHGLAFDHYPNGEDGPHFGTAYHCSAAGTVTRYSFGPGPLGPTCQIDDGENVEALSVMNASTFATMLLSPAQEDTIQTLGTMMHIAVLAFDQPQRTPGGQTVRAIWIGHVIDGFPTGRRAAGNLFAVCGRSGIEFPGCDASHGHVCGTATGQLTPNGDIPGVEVVRLLGFNPRVTEVPGPYSPNGGYAGGGYDKGKPR
jgi:hypothetical protein